MAVAHASMRRRIALAFTFVGVLAGLSCSDRDYGRYDDCDSVVRRCRTVCDYWCDSWGCYPMCFDQCWDDCQVRSRRPGASSGSTPPALADAAAPPTITDAGTPSGDGDGVLCETCASNDDCERGALCIYRGGTRPDASADAGTTTGRGFCGHACEAPSDCPQGFTCTNLGSSKQCLPNNGACQ